MELKVLVFLVLVVILVEVPRYGFFIRKTILHIKTKNIKTRVSMPLKDITLNDPAGIKAQH
jgi:hypothetical protein